MKLSKGLFLAFAGLGLFACSNEDVTENGGQIEGPADVVVKLNLPNMANGSRSVAANFTSNTAVTPNYVKITVLDGKGNNIGEKEGVYSTVDDENNNGQFTFQGINNPAKVVVEINTKTGSEGSWAPVNVSTIEALNVISVADTPMYGDTQNITVTGDQYTCTVDMEHTMARLEFGGIQHETHSGVDKCMFSDGDLAGILLNNVKLTSSGSLKGYNATEIGDFFKDLEPVTSPWNKIAGTDFFPSSTASYPSSGCYAYNIYPAEGAANLPVLTLYFSGLAVNPDYTDADGNKAHFIGDKGFASVSRYRVAKAGLSDDAKTALCGVSPVEIGSDYYQVVNFPAGYIYQVKNLSVTDEAVKTNPTGEGDELVATVVVTAWTIVTGSVDWK